MIDKCCGGPEVLPLERLAIDDLHDRDRELSGAPLVRMKNWSKASSEPVTQRISASESEGRSSGSVM